MNKSFRNFNTMIHCTPDGLKIGIDCWNYTRSQKERPRKDIVCFIRSLYCTSVFNEFQKSAKLQCLNFPIAFNCKAFIFYNVSGDRH